MTSEAQKRKQTPCESNLQQAYEQAIQSNDVEKFSELFKYKEVLSSSKTALSFAIESSNDLFLNKIMCSMKPADLRTYLQSDLKDTQETATPATKRRKICAKEATKEAKKLSPGASRLINAMVKDWPFQLARVVWTKDYQNAQSSTRPLDKKTLEKRWTKLFQISGQFFAGMDGKESDQLDLIQELVFKRLEEKALDSAKLNHGTEKFQAKLRNCRQTAKMVLSRILYIDSMRLVLAEPNKKSCKLNFRQLLKNYAVAIPAASFFKGNPEAFANSLRHHLNAKVLSHQNVQVTCIQYRGL